jgi:hypothetical protein
VKRHLPSWSLTGWLARTAAAACAVYWAVLISCFAVWGWGLENLPVALDVTLGGLLALWMSAGGWALCRERKKRRR